MADSAASAQGIGRLLPVKLNPARFPELFLLSGLRCRFHGDATYPCCDRQPFRLRSFTEYRPLFIRATELMLRISASGRSTATTLFDFWCIHADILRVDRYLSNPDILGLT